MELALEIFIFWWAAFLRNKSSLDSIHLSAIRIEREQISESSGAVKTTDFYLSWRLHCYPEILGCVSSFPTTLARCDRVMLCIAGVCSWLERNIAFLVMEWVIQDTAYLRGTLSCGVSYLTLLSERTTLRASVGIIGNCRMVSLRRSSWHTRWVQFLSIWKYIINMGAMWLGCSPPKKIAPKQGERREKKSSFSYEVDGIFSNLRRNSLALIDLIQKLGAKQAVHLTHKLL